MNNNKSFEDVFHSYAVGILCHEYLNSVFLDANFYFPNNSDDSVTIECQLYDGIFIKKTISTIGIDVEMAYMMCLLKVAIDAYIYYKQLSYADDCLSDEDDDCMYEYDEYPDCAHCEYFHECCGDMDVVDIDFYDYDFD